MKIAFCAMAEYSEVELIVRFGSWGVVVMDGDAVASQTWFGQDMAAAAAHFLQILDGRTPRYTSVFDEMA